MWSIPKMWEGGECWIIGGGPSMPREFGVPEDVIKGVQEDELPMSAYSPFLSAIHDKHVIGVNAAYLIGDWLDIIFFGDAGFYWENRRRLAKYGKIQASCNPNLNNNRKVINVKFTPRDGKYPYGISKRPNRVSWNDNTGACAINLAYHLGVKRVYLLGFDMQNDPRGYSHFHVHYSRLKNGKKGGVKPQRFAKHLSAFPAIVKDAKRLNLEVINVSPESKIEGFEKRSLSEIL